MKRIELGEGNEAVSRFGMLHATAFAGFAPEKEADARRLKVVQDRLKELADDPPSSLVLDDEDVALLKARVFGGGFQWRAEDNSRALDILDVLKAATEWKPEIVKDQREAAAG